MHHDNAVDASGVPIIVGAQGKIGILERRRDHLVRRLTEGRQGSPASADFDRAESEALMAGIRALRFHAARLAPDRDPVVALEKLSQAVASYLDGELDHEGLDDALEAAEVVLTESS